MRFRKAAWFLVGFLVLGVCAAYFGRSIVLYSIAAVLRVEDPLQKADAIFVLSGEFPNRAMEAAELYREGYAPWVILSYESEQAAFEILRRRGVRGAAPSNNDRNYGLLQALGVPLDHISTTNPSERTHNEAQEILALVSSRTDLRSLLVVTSPAHTRRAGRLMRQAFQGSSVEVRIRASRYELMDPKSWWKDNLQRRAIGHEWLALAAAPFLP